MRKTRRAKIVNPARLHIVNPSGGGVKMRKKNRRNGKRRSNPATPTTMRRKRRSNPSNIKGLAVQAVIAVGGALATNIGARFAQGFIPGTWKTNPFAIAAAQFATGLGVGFVGEKFMKPENANAFTLGALTVGANTALNGAFNFVKANSAKNDPNVEGIDGLGNTYLFNQETGRYSLEDGTPIDESEMPLMLAAV